MNFDAASRKWVRATGAKDLRLTIAAHADTRGKFAWKACCVRNGQFSPVTWLPRYRKITTRNVNAQRNKFRPTRKR